MARYAVWRARPDEPWTPLGWFWADGAHRRLPIPAAAVLMVLIGGLTVGFSPWALLFVPAILLHVRPDAPPPDLAPLATVPPPGPSFPARVEIWREGAMFGEDEGIVTFVEGWLHFAGRRTEFSLRRAGALRMEGRKAVVYDEETLRFDAPRGDAEDGNERFGRALAVWFHATPSPPGESMRPPRGVHPSGLARAWRDLAAPYTILVPIFVFVSLFASFHVFFAVGGFGVPGLAWMRLRTLHRRAREERRSLRAREAA